MCLLSSVVFVESSIKHSPLLTSYIPFHPAIKPPIVFMFLIEADNKTNKPQDQKPTRCCGTCLPNCKRDSNVTRAQKFVTIWGHTSGLYRTQSRKSCRRPTINDLSFEERFQSVIYSCHRAHLSRILFPHCCLVHTRGGVFIYSAFLTYTYGIRCFLLLNPIISFLLVQLMTRNDFL